MSRLVPGALCALLATGCGLPAPERTWTVPAALHDTAWGPYETAIGALRPHTHRGLQQAARTWLALEEALAGTRMAPEDWNALLAAAVPTRLPAELPSPFGPGEHAGEVHLAGTRLRAFGNVLGTLDPARATLTALRGPNWQLGVSSEVDPGGAWRDRLDGVELPGGTTGWLRMTSQLGGTACPSPWRGTPGVAAPVACLAQVASARVEGEARPGGRPQDVLRLRLESHEGAQATSIGAVRVPGAWRLRLGLPDLNVDAHVNLMAAGDLSSAVRQAEGTLVAVTPEGLEKLRFTWRRGEPLILESASSGLRGVLGGPLPWRIEATRDGSPLARVEQFGLDEGTRTWIATVTRRDGATRTWVLAPADWRVLPDSPALGEVREADALGAWPGRPQGFLSPEPHLNVGAQLP